MRKKLICIVLGIALLIFGVSCTTSRPNDGVVSNDTTETKTPETEDESLLSAVLPEIATYKLVVSSALGGKELEVAQAISTCFEKLLSVESVWMTDDTAVYPMTEKEILLGKTSREGSVYTSEFDSSALSLGEYYVEVISGRVVLHYNDPLGMLYAGLTLLESIGQAHNPETEIKGELYRMVNTMGFTSGNIKTKNIYASNMLFQQNKPLVISGTGDAGYVIEATLERDGKAVTTSSVQIDKNGSWTMELEGQKGSYDSYEIAFHVLGKEVLRYQDVLIGELWIATGQSNMYYSMGADKDRAQVKYDDPYFRTLRITAPESGYPITPMEENPTAKWHRGDQADMRSVSAVGYYFATRLRAELDVPVGLLFYAVGGAPIRAWISEETLQNEPDIKQLYLQTGRYTSERAWASARAPFHNQSALYNIMTNTVKGLNIAGVLWYQGEQDCSEGKNSYLQELWCLYEQFCREFNFPDRDMPFLYPTIAPYLPATNYPFGCGLFTLQMTSFAQENEHAVCVPIYDVSPQFRSDNNASHPETKKPVGIRLAESALSLVYAADHDARPPHPVSWETSGNSLIVTFENVGDGLMTVPYATKVYTVEEDRTPLRGFTVCGEDGVYYMAEAEVIGKNQIRLTSESVDKPISACYAVKHLTYNCNLASSRKGEVLFMASPFQIGAPEKTTLATYHDWMDCDLPQIWHTTKTPVHWGRYYDAWLPVLPESGSLALVHTSEEAYQGNASLKLTYQTEDRFGAAVNFTGITSDNNPILFTDVQRDYRSFRTVRFWVKVTSGTVTCHGIAFSDGTAPLTSEAVLTEGDAWQMVTVDLAAIRDANGNLLGTEALKSISKLELLFSAEGSGTLYIDDIQFLK